MAATSTGPSLVLLRPESALLTNVLSDALNPEPTAEPAHRDVRVTDFDEVPVWLRTQADDPAKLLLSMSVPNFQDLVPLGVHEYLAATYGALLAPPGFPGAAGDVTLLMDTRALPLPASEVISKAAMLRRHIVAYPLVRLMTAVAGGRGDAEAPFVWRFRPRDPMYLLPKKDRLVVIFALEFDDPTDRALARVVAAEMTEAYRAVNNGPPCAWSEREPPAELRAFPTASVVKQTDACIGYITLTMFPANFEKEAAREHVATQLSLFRNFLQYHLKASKANLHARMRRRVDALQQALGRALLEVPAAEREKKLASGKTFVRKD